MAYDNGLNGIVVSNHGGRNMDTARPALEALIEIMAALRAHNFDPSKFEVRMPWLSWPFTVNNVLRGFQMLAPAVVNVHVADGSCT
jgi:hypothetical protein